MKVIIYGKGESSKILEKKIKNCLEDLGLVDFVGVEISQDDSLKKELSFSKQPALIIEEESIDFKDVIFEGISPDEEELKSMFISIIGGSEGGGGCSSGSCSSCSSPGSC